MPATLDPSSARVVVLSGGTGGAKLARGLADVCGDHLTVVANTGDDIEIHGGHVSPDPDLCAFWLANVIDDRGWGLADDTFNAMDAIERDTGERPWFALGDRDLEICVRRAQELAAGRTLTKAHGQLCEQLGLSRSVLPMSDDPVRTVLVSGGRRIGIPEFLTTERGAAPIDDVVFEGAAAARPTAQVLQALAAADVIVIGPSNPMLSIGPILAIDGMREALVAAAAPVVAVSPVVGGKILKGPTAACMRWLGLPVTASGVARHYGPVLNGLVSDEPTDDRMPPHLQRPIELSTPDQRHDVAAAVVEFGLELR